MKASIKNLLPVMVIGIAAILTAFDVRPGAHSFQVLLDNKLVIDRYVDRSMKPQVIELSRDSKTLEVRYSECGRTVSGRALTAKDSQDNVLKVWRYEGSTSGFKDPMPFDVKELRTLAASQAQGVKIIYSSNDFPDGLHFFTAVAGNSTVAGGN